MSVPNTPSASPEPAAEHPSPRNFKPGPILDFDNDEMSTVAGRLHTKAQQDAASMLLGYGTVLLGTITLQHGVISKREKSTAALQKLERSFKENGVLRYSNPIVLLVELDDLDYDDVLATKLDGDIPSVTFVSPDNDSKPVVLCAAGQHREAVVLHRIEELETELAALKEGDEPDDSAAKVLESRIQGERVWAAAFYKKSAILNSDDPAATAVGNILSSNQRLWQWEATPQELWQLAIRWILRFGTDKEVLLKAIGETRKFPWLAGLIVKEDWREALTVLLKYPGLKKDALLKECGRWCTQPYSQVALFYLETHVAWLVELSSTSSTHYPELWSEELASFLLDQWSTVKRQIKGSPEAHRGVLVDEYLKVISERLAEQWDTTVVMENGEEAPTMEDILAILSGYIGPEVLYLSWEVLKLHLKKWEASGEALNEVSRWLDPAMGGFHSRAQGSIKLGTATEYLWSDIPKSPNLEVSEHKDAFVTMLTELHDDFRNMSIAVLDLRERFKSKLSDAENAEIEKLVDYYVNQNRVTRKSAPKNSASTPDPGFHHMVKNLMRHSAIQFNHFDIKNRPKNYRRYITSLASESKLQKDYLPTLRLHTSVQTVRSLVQDFYQERDPNLSIYWNDYGGGAVQKGKAVRDDQTYDQQLQLIARESILKQFTMPYKRLVESGSIPQGLGRDAMLEVLSAISQHLGGEEDADLDADEAALKKLLGPSPSDEEYEPSDETESESESEKKQRKKRPSQTHKPSKEGKPMKKKGKGKAPLKKPVEESATAEAATQLSPVSRPSLPIASDAGANTKTSNAIAAASSSSALDTPVASANPGPSDLRRSGKALAHGGAAITQSANVNTPDLRSVAPIPASTSNPGPSDLRKSGKALAHGDTAIAQSANVNTPDLRSVAPIPVSASLAPEDRFRTPTQNPFIKSASKKVESLQPQRPRVPIPNPFAAKPKSVHTEFAKDPFQMPGASGSAGASSSRKRQDRGERGEDSEIEELKSGPVEKKTRIAPKDKVNFIGRREI